MESAYFSSSLFTIPMKYISQNLFFMPRIFQTQIPDTEWQSDQRLFS